MTDASRIQRRVLVVITILLLSSLSIAMYRLYRMNFDLEQVLPQRIYNVSVIQTFTGHGMPVDLNLFLPRNDHRQRIVEEHSDATDFVYESFREGDNRKGKWSRADVSGHQTIRYSVTLSTRALRYELDSNLGISDVQSEKNTGYLNATDAIQTTAPEIVRTARRLIPGDGTVYSLLQNSYSFVKKFTFKPFKGTTDALTALRLGEASCNGRSRLLVALLRANGIAARLVGGLVMSVGEKKTSHQWVEARINDTWIPMDPTNGHFMEIPQHYLVLYRGDEALLKHTGDIGYDYRFSISRKMVPAQEISEDKNFAGFSYVFRSMGIPIELLKSIIMIPLAALVVVMFRNVIGLSTFGTFLPALMAVAFRNTGAVWGIVGFTSIILMVSLLRRGLSRLQLLHSPQLGVMLTAVISLLLFAAFLGSKFTLGGLARVSLFPMVLVAITSERFSIMEIEEGVSRAWWTMAQTLLVVTMAWLVMRSLSLQVIMMSFPELLLAVAALNIWIGRWVGLRASEWIRFRQFVFQTTTEGGAQ